MRILLVYNQGNFKNLETIEKELKSYNHLPVMPENSLLRSHKTDVSKMTDKEIKDYIQFTKEHIRVLDCILIVNNDYDEDYKSYDIDSIARLKISLAKYCSKPVFVLNEFPRLSKSDELPICINNNLTEISLKFNEATEILKARKKAINIRKNNIYKEKNYKEINKEKIYK